MSEQLEEILVQVGEKSESGAAVLDSVYKFIGRFCVFPSDHCQVAITLWAALTHAIEHFHIAPRLALLSPEPSSGKTRVLEILNLLVPDPMFTLNASSASIFRLLAENQISLLFDEVDTVWKGGGKDDSQEDLRALLNAGYKRGAKIPRCVGPKHEVQLFNVFCAVALAGIGEPPETILSRSVIIKMRRRAPDEPVEPFRTRIHESQGHSLRDRLANWMSDAGEAAGDAWPDLPTGIVDRPAEIWEPLLAVADAAGGNWPETARKACKDLCNSAQDRRVSLGIRLLGDLKKLFGDADKLSTADILNMLISEKSELGDDAPWPDLYGKPIDSRKLARLLKPYGVHSKKIRFDNGTLQGYERIDLNDSWKRWLPPPTPAEAEQAEHPEQVSSGAGSSVPDKSSVPDRSGTSGNGKNGESSEMFRQQTEHATKTEHSNPYGVRDVPDVPDVPDLRTPMAEGSEYDNSGTEEVVV